MDESGFFSLPLELVRLICVSRDWRGRTCLLPLRATCTTLYRATRVAHDSNLVLSLRNYAVVGDERIVDWVLRADRAGIAPELVADAISVAAALRRPKRVRVLAALAPRGTCDRPVSQRSQRRMALESALLAVCQSSLRRGEDVSVVEALVEAGADVNRLGIQGALPLQAAARQGDAAICGALLAAGARVDEILPASAWKETALLIACGRPDSNVETVRALLAGGADVMRRDTLGSTSLHRAAVNGHLAIVEAMGAEGEMLLATDTFGQTALHRAAEHGSVALCAALVAMAGESAGALRRARDDLGRTSFMRAVACGHMGCAPVLDGQEVAHRDARSRAAVAPPPGAPPKPPQAQEAAFFSPSQGVAAHAADLGRARLARNGAL